MTRRHLARSAFALASTGLVVTACDRPNIVCLQQFDAAPGTVLGAPSGWTVTGDWRLYREAPRSVIAGVGSSTDPIPFANGPALGTDGNRNATYLTAEDLTTEWWESYGANLLQEVESSSATSPSDTIPLILEFDSWNMDPFNNGYTHNKIVELSVAGGPWIVLASCSAPAADGQPWAFCSGPAQWEHIAIPLQSYVGQSGRLRLRYDSVSPGMGWERGWYVDNLNFAQTACDELDNTEVVYARNDTFSVANGTVLTGQNVVTNDWAQNGTRTVTGADAISELGATVAVAANGALTYTPPAGVWGRDTFEYTLGDGAGHFDDATVTVDVRPASFPLTQVGVELPGIVLDPSTASVPDGRRPVIVGDVNGDGRDDIAWTATIGAATQSVVLFGTADPDDLATPAEAVAGLGGFAVDGTTWPHAVGDVNGDGRADILFGLASAWTPPAIVVFGKADTAPVQHASVVAGTGGFAIVSDIENGTGYPDQILGVGGGGDFDGDGRNDLVFAANYHDHGGVTNSGATFVVFGKNNGTTVNLSTLAATGSGTIVHGHVAAGPTPACGGTDLLRDADGDGYSDLWVSCPNTSSGYLVSGRPGPAIIDVQTGQGVVQPLVGAVAAHSIGDVDGDGLSDLQSGNNIVFGGDLSTPLTTADLAAGIGGTVLVGSVGWLGVPSGGDVDGDGFDDFRINSGTQGLVVFGRDGGDPIDLASAANGFGGLSISPGHAQDRTFVGDVDGDGFGDLVMGRRVLLGDAFGNAVTLQGGPGNDSLIGTAAAEIVVGGAGNDSLSIHGGADVAHGGAGNDWFSVDGTEFALVDGGTGTDLLIVNYAGDSIDLDDLDGRVRNIEEIRIIQGTTVYLGAVDLARISDHSNTLTINGLSDTTVIADLTGGGFSEIAYPPYLPTQGVTNGVLTLIVDSGADLQIVQ